MITFENYMIRPLEIADLDRYYELVDKNRKRLEDFFTGTVSKTPNKEATENFLREMDAKRKNREYYPYVLVDLSTSNFVVFIDLKNVDWTIPKTEIGCYTDAEFAGKGLTTKAMKLFVAYCFENFDFKKIYLRTYHTNKAAQIVAEKCGFEWEGTIRMDYITTAGKLVDLMYYGRLR